MSGISFMFLKQGSVLYFPCLFPENSFFKTGYYLLCLGKGFPGSLMCVLGIVEPLREF